MSHESIIYLSIDDVIPFVNQSRERFDEGELTRLAEDIQANGQLQPGVAWFDAGRGKHVLICGERRWRAIRMAGLRTMTVKVIEGLLTPGQMLAINLSENIQRANLDAVERAKAFQRLAQLEGLNNKELAERTHVSVATVSRDLAILGLPDSLLARVQAGEIPTSVAYELSRIDDPAVQEELVLAVGTVSRDRFAELVRDRVGRRKTSPKAGRLTFKLAGVCVNLTAEQALTRVHLQAVGDRLRQEAKKLPPAPPGDGGDAAEDASYDTAGPAPATDKKG